MVRLRLRLGQGHNRPQPHFFPNPRHGAVENQAHTMGPVQRVRQTQLIRSDGTSEVATRARAQSTATAFFPKSTPWGCGKPSPYHGAGPTGSANAVNQIGWYV